MSSDEVPLPRSFKLLEEYDAAIGKRKLCFLRGQHANYIQYGLVSDDDMDLHLWRATIIGPQGKQTGEFIYTLEIYCSKNYPEEPPRIKFISPKIIMDAVNNQGNISLNKLEPAFQWKSNMNIADILMAVRDNLCLDKVTSVSGGLGETSY